MKLSLLLLLELFATLCFLSSCAYKEPIKIGYVAGLTGFHSELGISGRRGLEIAVEDINNSGGIYNRKLLLVTKDDENNPETGLKAVTELHQEGITSIIGHMTSGANTLSFDYINKNKILMISPTVSSIYFSNKDDFYFRLIAQNTLFGQALASLALKRNYRKIAAVYDLNNKAYTQPIFNSFQAFFEQSGGKIVFLNTFYAGSHSLFKDLAQKMLRSGADSLLVLLSGLDCALLAQQLEKAKSLLPIFVAPWSMTPDIIPNGGKAVEKIVFLSVFDPNSQNPAYLNFRKKHLEWFKTEPSFAAVYTYDALFVLAQTMKQSPSLNPVHLKKTLLTTEKYQGLQSDIEFNQYGDVIRTYYFFKILNGEFIKTIP